LGSCYGKTRVSDQGDYLKLCGQDFWEFISGNSNLYIDIIKPLGHRAKERNEAFQAEYAKVITRFTGEFIADFCTPDDAIIWERVLKLNSGSDKRLTRTSTANTRIRTQTSTHPCRSLTAST
jgi:hypothetical protein